MLMLIRLLKFPFVTVDHFILTKLQYALSTSIVGVLGQTINKMQDSQRLISVGKKKLVNMILTLFLGNFLVL